MEDSVPMAPLHQSLVFRKSQNAYLAKSQCFVWQDNQLDYVQQVTFANMVLILQSLRERLVHTLVQKGITAIKVL